MANVHRGEVRLEIGGRDRVLRFDMNALAELEDRLKMPLSLIFNENNVGVRTIRECLFVGLRHRDRKLTPKDVGDWMEFDRMTEYGEVIGQALALATGQDPKAATGGDDDDGPLAPTAAATAAAVS